MAKIGIDLGKSRSDVCVMGQVDKVTERVRISTTRAGFARAFATRVRSEIAIESCRDSRWVSKQLSSYGHTVIVVDTRRVRSIGVGQNRRKTDRRDAEALARALWTGVVPRAHVVSDRIARLRDLLHTRAQLVGQRTSLVTMVRGQWQSHGACLPRCKARYFARHVRNAEHELASAPHIQAVLQVLDVVNEQIDQLETQLDTWAKTEESYERLCSVPGVKRIVSLAFIAAIDRPERFDHAHQVQAYLGLVPSESSTGGKQRLGSLTKTGNSMARWTLIQAAHILMRMPRCAQDPLVVWAKQVQERRGKRIAAVALARRLAGILWALWIDKTTYDAQGLGRASARGLSRRARRAHALADEMNLAATAA